MKILAKISASLTAVLVFCLLWHILMPVELGWMISDQIWGTIGMLLFSSGIAFSTFIYNEVNDDQ